MTDIDEVEAAVDVAKRLLAERGYECSAGPDDLTLWSEADTVYDGDFEVRDYTPLDGLMAEDRTMHLPGCCTWTHCGEGDSDAPDCTLEYSVPTAALG